MELRHLNTSEESIGESLEFYIKNAVEQVMNKLLEEGFSESELEDGQSFIEGWVINDAQDALSYYFEGDTIRDIVNKVQFHRQFKEKIRQSRESEVERIVQEIVPEEQYDNYSESDITDDLEFSNTPFTDENIRKIVKEKYEIK